MPSQIRAITTDRRGNLWLTMEGAIAMIDVTTFDVELYDADQPYGIAYSKNLIYVDSGLTISVGRRGTDMYYTPGLLYSVFVDRRSNVLVGSMDGPVYLLDFRARL